MSQSLLRFGLIDGHERTLEEIGKRFVLTRERIWQIEGMDSRASDAIALAVRFECPTFVAAGVLVDRMAVLPKVKSGDEDLLSEGGDHDSAPGDPELAES